MPLTRRLSDKHGSYKHGGGSMAKEAGMSGGRSANPWRIAGWGMAGLLLLLPLVAMQFTSEVNWTPSDFVFAAVVFGSVGILFELAVRMSRDPWYRAGVAAALGASFLIVWANAAVGMIGSEDNPYNLLFLGVILLALVGAVAARFRASGMALALAMAAIAQVCIAVAGMASDPRGAVFSAVFAGLWLLAAACFRNAARAS